MVKIFKTKEERDLAFVSKMWERPKRTDKLKEVLSYSQIPYEIKAYLSDPELNKSFRYIGWNHEYQILYLAVDSNYNLVLTTTIQGYQARFPISVIYSEFFPREGTLRERMGMLATRYLSEFNQLLSEVSPLELKISHTFFGNLFLNFDYKED
jgi:hypothetical protein